MGDAIKIVVTAETADAANKLYDFARNSGLALLPYEYISGKSFNVVLNQDHLEPHEVDCAVRATEFGFSIHLVT